MTIFSSGWSPLEEDLELLWRPDSDWASASISVPFRHHCRVSESPTQLYRPAFLLVTLDHKCLPYLFLYKESKLSPALQTPAAQTPPVQATLEDYFLGFLE